MHVNLHPKECITPNALKITLNRIRYTNTSNELARIEVSKIFLLARKPCYFLAVINYYNSKIETNQSI